MVAACVLALGVAACSVGDAKAEASASASASASAAIARAEKGIADANASATASREAALTPELRAKRDAALAEPAPAKPPQLNEESAEGAAGRRDALITEASSPPKQLHTPPGRATLPVQTVH